MKSGRDERVKGIRYNIKAGNDERVKLKVRKVNLAEIKDWSLFSHFCN